MGKYFSKFPAITYNGHIAKNILRRAAILNRLNNSPNTYYDYTIPEEVRADVLSNDYYDNPDFAWLIYLTNGIIDPHHDYYLSEGDFHSFLIKKYGSIQFAMNNVHSWVLSWGADTREITPAQYEALPSDHRKYWTGLVTNAFALPNRYIRMRDETKISTNRMAIVSDEDASTYAIGSVFIGEDEAENEFRAIVDSTTSDTVTLKHIIGAVSGDEYVMPANLIYHHQNISPDETTYWLPLTLYDFEAAKNAAKRNISLVNKQLTYQVEKDLKRVLNG